VNVEIETRADACDVDRRGFLRNCTVIAAAALAAGASGVAAEQVRAAFVTGSGAGPRAVMYAVPTEDGVLVDREHSILLTRWQRHLYAFSMICPHQRAAVKWLEADARFQCTKHKSKYSGAGVYLSGRATRGLDRHPIHVANGQVIVDDTVLLKEDEDAAAWQAAVAMV
jgi:Rieske Fe-S protein